MTQLRSGVLSFLGAVLLLLSTAVVVSADGPKPSHVECTTSPCVISQSGAGDQEAACILDGPGALTCTITQTGTGRHFARCIQHSSGPSATQTCSISQTNTSGDNRAEVLQQIEQNDCQPPATTSCNQLGVQTARIQQHNVSGDNAASSRQNGGQQIGDEDNGGSFTNELQQLFQRSLICQNAIAFSSSCGAAASPLPSGGNSARLEQAARQFGHTEATATPQSLVTQDQENSQAGHIDQHSSGVSSATGTERSSQKLHAPAGTTQTQDPDEFCCSAQGTNPADTFDIDQHSDQMANPDASQTGRSGGNCVTAGNCHVDQTITQNGATQTNSVSGMNVHTGFNCFNASCSPNFGSPGEG